MEHVAQTIPLRIYRAPDHVVLVAPMPGLEPQDISVTIADNFVSIMGKERGPGQHNRELIVNEWRIGPYFREVSLDQPVNGALTNATYGNGVLVLSMPTMKDGKSDSEAAFELTPVEATRGERIGHIGSEIRPTSSVQHSKKHKSERSK